MTRIEIVVIVHQSPRILLGMKKRKFGKGKYNGFGGGVKLGETLEQAAIRETWEETGKGITIISPEKMGKILFQFQTDEQNHLVHFFRAVKYKGKPRESNEMTIEWFNEDAIPYNKMWADDRYWLPLLLNGRKFDGNFVFDGNYGIVKYNLNEIID